MFLTKIEIDLTLSEIKEFQSNNGGFKPSHRKESNESSWATSSVLKLHKITNFLSVQETQKAISFLLKTFIEITKKDETKCMYGWGSFSPGNKKKPIPVVTASVLNAIHGLHLYDKIINKIYLQATLWLISIQKDAGYWCDPNDYFSNYEIILFFDKCKKQNPINYNHIKSSIEGCLHKAQQYYSANEINSTDKANYALYLLIIKILDIPLVPSFQNFGKITKYKVVKENSTDSGENFGFTKYTYIYYLYAMELFNDSHINSYEPQITGHLRNIYRSDHLFSFDSCSTDTCLWYTADVLFLLYTIDSLRSKKEIDNIGYLFYKHPWWRPIARVAMMVFDLVFPALTGLKYIKRVYNDELF